MKASTCTCGERTRAPLPEGVSPLCYGTRLAAFVAMLNGEFRQSHRQIQEMLKQVFRIEIARGTINRMRQEVSEAVAAATEEAMEFAQQQRVLNCDETGFSQSNKDGKNPEQKRAWLWVLVSPLVSVFIVTLSRSQAIAKDLIGESFCGFLGSNRFLLLDSV